MFLPLTTSLVDSVMKWNTHETYHPNRPEVMGDVRLGAWGSGSNSHFISETSNFASGFGVRTKVRACLIENKQSVCPTHSRLDQSYFNLENLFAI